MRHLAIIQSEFLKCARGWDDLTIDEQRAYLKQHPKSKKRLTAKLRPKVELKSAKVIDGKLTRENGLDDLPETVRLKGFIFRGHSPDESITSILQGQSWTPELAVARMFSEGKVTRRQVDLLLYNQKSGFGTEKDKKKLRRSGYDGVIFDITSGMGEDYTGYASEVNLFDDKIDNDAVIEWKKTAAGGIIGQSGDVIWKIREAPMSVGKMFWVYWSYINKQGRLVSVGRYTPTGSYDDSVHFLTVKDAKEFVEKLKIEKGNPKHP